MTTIVGEPSRHFFITRSVARVMGVSLSEAMQSGDLAPEGYASMVNRCRGCALVEACQEWLSSQAALAHTPLPGCMNAGALTELRQKT
ncbi:MAG: DUF6455 family protein [Paracoccaceae bacterium]|nr:DUF6455 family protein [Paracoccaceae bacterium]